MVVLVVFNVRGKEGNLREFFFLGGGGGDCEVYFPANTTHENPKVGRAHFFSRAFAFSYEVALSPPFDNAELWIGSFFACFLFLLSFLFPSFSYPPSFSFLWTGHEERISLNLRLSLISTASWLTVPDHFVLMNTGS